MNKKIFFDLSNILGISGDENDVYSYLKKSMPDAEISSDKLGSFIAKMGNTNENLKVLFAAHMDEVGFVVSDITKNGFLKILPIGGWFIPTAIGNKVVVKGKTDNFVGIIASKPPHLLSPEERKKEITIDDIFLDVGAKSDKEVKNKMKIYPNAPVIPYPDCGYFNKKNLLYGKAWDDRLGCAGLIYIYNFLAKNKVDKNVFLVGTVQEEVGIRGAKTATYTVNPDVAIVLEVSVAKDVAKEEDSPVKLGNGLTFDFYDRTMLANRQLLDFAIELCEKYKIRYHLGYSKRGGTDGGNIHLSFSGIPTIVIGIPTRYIHSFYSVFDYNDFKELQKFVEVFLRNISKEILEK